MTILAYSNPFIYDVVSNGLFCVLMKAQLARMKINLPKSFFLNNVKARAKFYLVKIKTSMDIFGSECVKLLLVLSLYDV